MSSLDYMKDKDYKETPKEVKERRKRYKKYYPRRNELRRALKKKKLCINCKEKVKPIIVYTSRCKKCLKRIRSKKK